MQSKNFRIRGRYDCNRNIEEDIKELEKQYGIDFKSLTQWRNIIENINATRKYCQKKLLNAEKRKYQIIEKLYVQNYRTSPFVLTHNFSRTSKFRKEEKVEVKRQHLPSKTECTSMSLHNVSVDNVILSEENDIESNIHPNSEVFQLKDQIFTRDKEPDSYLNSPHYLPPAIYTNPHKLLSSIRSSEKFLNYIDRKNNEKDFKSELVEDILSKQTILVQCCPAKLIITSNTKREQVLKFTILNKSTKYVQIRLEKLSDTSYFKSLKIFPLIPIKLNPGLSQNYKFSFTFQDNIDVRDVSLVIYLRIRSIIAEEILCLPIESQVEKYNAVVVTETVKIPEVYLWQVNAKCGYPKGIVQINVCNNTSYNMYIRKKDIDFIKEMPDLRSINSLEVIAPETESLIEKSNDDEMKVQDGISLPPRITSNALDIINIENEALNSFNVVTLVLNDILNIVFDPFIFRNTFLQLRPKSKRIVLIYFTKAEHIGYHHSYYNLIFSDSDSNIFVKTVKVFAEVLPNPILIYPNILNLVESPVVFGHCNDHFTIMNMHKAFPVSITIEMTRKTKKIFQITPKIVSIPAKSKVNFNIKFCRGNLYVSQKVGLMAYFTIKIIVRGNSPIYNNFPPFYYEIITPCPNEFMKNYLKEYRNDSTALKSQETFQND